MRKRVYWNINRRNSATLWSSTMTNQVQTQAQESTVEGVIAQWTSGKKTKSAHTEVGLMTAPKKARDNTASAMVLHRLSSGRFDGFTRDIVGALSEAHKKALATHMGRLMMPAVAGATVSIDLAVMAQGPINKATFRAIAQFVVKPRAVIKGIEQDKPLAKSLDLYATTCQAWLDSQAATAPAAPVIEG